MRRGSHGDSEWIIGDPNKDDNIDFSRLIFVYYNGENVIVKERK